MILLDPPASDQQPLDIILISGEYWADHPHSGVGVIARVLSEDGYNVGIIEKPNWSSTEDFIKLGMPRLFWGITSGAIDSMLQNYTPLKRLRKDDPHKPYDSKIPDRSVIVYAQKLREAQNQLVKQSGGKKNHKAPIIIGGVEASLRRFTHYDYWDNDLRRSILLDSRADLLVYGPGEYQIKEIAYRLENGESLYNIEGTCIVESEIPKNLKITLLPSHEDIKNEKKEFCKMQLLLTNSRNIVQPVKNRYIIQFKQHQYTTEELDDIYNLPFSYDIPKKYKEFKMAKFSIITHRGCFGGCNFCAINLHQGNKIVSRSLSSILKEIEKMSNDPEFKGFIDDIGGASANMYGMDCKLSNTCEKNCMDCELLDKTHKTYTNLLEQSREISGVKKTFVRSGIRYDLALDADPRFLEELINHHISGYLKIAPEHLSQRVCELMNKPCERFEEFLERFKELNHNNQWILKYYFITAHPGSTIEDAKVLAQSMKKLGKKKTNKVQIFTPTPMSISACMYYTGLDPYTLKPIYVPYSYKEKKKQKRILF